MLGTNFSVKQISDNKLKVHLNSTYIIDQNFKYFYTMPLIVNLFNEKNMLIQKKYSKVFKITYFPTIELDLEGGKVQEEKEKCTICYEKFQSKTIEIEASGQYDDDILMLECSHKFHKKCLLDMIKDKEWVRCPNCFVIFGTMIGDQPKGNMTFQIDKNLQCSGYPPGTIVIYYNFLDGKLDNGQTYRGTTRRAYLPNNREGREVLQLLKEAFKRRLLFTVSTSVTTGQQNTVIWNSIHQKTNLRGGSANYGYPDPEYFRRVKKQLADKGVTPKE